jgi:hypothetical protein
MTLTIRLDRFVARGPLSCNRTTAAIVMCRLQRH